MDLDGSFFLGKISAIAMGKEDIGQKKNGSRMFSK